MRGVFVATAIVALLSIGCSHGTEPSPTPSFLPTPSVIAAKPFCTVELPQSWKEALTRAELPINEGDRFIPTAVGADGSKAFGDLFGSDWSGVVAVSPNGEIMRISEFADRANDQISGSGFDGRWFVWSEDHSLTNWNDWDLKAWDSMTGEVKVIASTPRVSGEPVSGPFILPVVSDGRAAWVQANESGQGEVHVFSLVDGLDDIVASGDATQPVAFWGPNVVWAETDVPGESAHLEMADAATGLRVDVPEPLSSIRHWGTSFVATPTVVAWDDGTSLWVWRPEDSNPQQILKAELGDYVEFVAIAGELVTWGGVKNQWAADLRSGSATKITDFGWRYGAGDALAIMWPVGPQKDTTNPRSQSAIVDAASLPSLPACPS